MLQELSYRKKIPSVDILTMECVASCNTTITKSDPKTTIGQLSAMFKNIALPKGYGITRESLKSLYDHSFDGDIDFAALSVITDILSKGIILSHWADAHTIVDKTSVIAAPIEINNERYYAVLISGKKKSEFKYPYVMRVFSDACIKDELLNIYRTSPQGVTTSRQNADFQKFAANLLINYILNNSDLSFLTTNSTNTQNNDNNPQPINCNRNMNKKIIRLTEQDLHKIVKESVGKVINEAYRYNYNSQAKARAFEEAISIIEKTAKKLQKMTNDESEFGGKAYEIGECATSILRLLDEYSLSDGGFNAFDMADYEANPDYDTRNLGDYGTDIDGNWMYDENPDDEGYQYWLNNTRKGRKYAKHNDL